MRRLSCAITALLVAFLFIGLTAGCGDDGEETSVTQPSQATEATTGEDTTSASVTEPIELSLAAASPTTNDGTFMLLEEWAERIGQETNGKVKITVYPGGTLCDQTKIFDALLTGMADIAEGPAGWAPARFPLTSFSGDALHRCPDSVVATKLMDEVWKTPAIADEWVDFQVLWVCGQHPSYFLLKDRAETMDDLRGRQIRTAGSQGPWATAVGVTPVDLPTGEIYQALQKGIIEGAYIAADKLETMKLVEVTSCAVRIPMCTGVFVTLVTKETWDSFPDDVKTVFESASAWARDEMALRWDEDVASALDYAKTEGHEVIEPAPEEMTKILDALYAEGHKLAARQEDQGNPGTEVLRGIAQAEEKYFDEVLYDYYPVYDAY